MKDSPQGNEKQRQQKQVEKAQVVRCSLLKKGRKVEPSDKIEEGEHDPESFRSRQAEPPGQAERDDDDYAYEKD